MSSAIKTLKNKIEEKKIDREARKRDLVDGNATIMEITAPGSLDLEDDDYIKIGRQYRNYSYVRNWEPGLDPQWLKYAFLGQKGYPITSILCDFVDKRKMKKSLSSTVVMNEMTASGNASASRKVDARISNEHADKMLQMLSDSNEKMMRMQVFQALNHSDKEELAKMIDNRDSDASGYGMSVESCTKNQEYAFLVNSPYRVRDQITESPAGVPTVASTVAGSGIFSATSLDDGFGVRCGHTKNGDIVRMETMVPTDTRTNCNVTIVGSSGKGKTTASQKIRLSEFIRGGRQISFDADGEGIAITKFLGGQVIDIGKGMHRDKDNKWVGACICPLEPRLGDYDPDKIFDEKDVDGDDLFDYSSETDYVLRSTMTFIHGWATQMWAIENRELPYLDEGLVRAYARYGINYDTTASQLVKDHYPIFDDVAEEFTKLYEDENDPYAKSKYRELASLCRQCGVDGIYGNLFGHRTNIDLKSDWIDIVTSELTSAEAHVCGAQLYSTLSWTWKQACIARAINQFLRVFIDELYMYLGSGSIAGSKIVAGYINMMQKRGRKYFMGLMIATQQLVDVLHEDIKRFGESLLSNSSYKFFFGTEGEDLKLLCQTFDLSDRLKRMVGGFGRGWCLATIGKEQVEMKFEWTDRDKVMYGTKNGR